MNLLYSPQYGLYFGCSHGSVVKYGELNFCHICGIVMHREEVRVYKCLNMRFGVFFNPQRLLESLSTGTLPYKTNKAYTEVEFNIYNIYRNDPRSWRLSSK
jgi:hypothetical protein